jgi:ubiquitin carboxyl-terminal hydrolase 8
MSKKINHCGLKNRGNTCFMNTFLQCLMSVDELNQYFLSQEYIHDLAHQMKRRLREKKKELTPTTLLTQEYGNMLHEFSQNKLNMYNPKGFHEYFQRLHSSFAGFQQHDTVEALTLVLDGFHESLKYSLKVSYSGTNDNDMDKLMVDYAESLKTNYKDNYSKIYDLFNADMVQYIDCKEHDRDSEILSTRFEPYTMTLLDIPTNIKNPDIYDCFDDFFCDESLDDDNLYFDEKSKMKVKSDIRKRYIRLPEYLIISLKRFKKNHMGFSYKKNDTTLSFPFGNDLLDLSDYTDGYEKANALYDLHCVGIHSGSMNGGHYYSYCKNPDNDKFYVYNDEHVSEVNLNDCKNDIYTQGYLLIYKKYIDPE